MHINKLAIIVAAATAAAGTQACPHMPGCRANRCYAFTSMSVSSSYSMTRSQSQREMGYSSSSSSSLPTSNPGLRRGDGDDDMRKLSTKEATVLHYTDGSLKLSREAVVEAVKEVIDGVETNFQLNMITPGEDATLQVLLLNYDSMTVSTQEFDKEFTIKNAFIKKSPDTIYQVYCPAKVDGDTCTVTVFCGAAKKLDKPDRDGDGHDLVTCFTEDSTITKEDIPTECGDEMYDMALYALPGPHFILAGTKSLHSSSVNPICPKSIAFSTMDGGFGRKQIVSPYMEDFKDLPKHTLGVAALIDVLEAESSAEAIDEASFDMLENNCVHYASSIWRRLEIDETEDLGNFVVHNIIIDEDLLEKLASKVQGGRMLLNSMLNKRLEEFVKNVVYEYFNLN